MENIENRDGLVSKVIRDFYETDDLKKCVGMMFESICTICRIDIMSNIVYNDILNKYLNMYGYNKTDGVVAYTAKLGLTIDNCINVLNNIINDDMQFFIDSCNHTSFLHSRNFSEVEDLLKKVGFYPSNPSIIKEIFVFPYVCEGAFSYFAFEIHNENYLSQWEVDTLCALCKVLHTKIEKKELIKQRENGILMRDIVLENEEMPIAVVEKESHNVLFFNELFRKIIPSIKIGEPCNDLLSNSKNAADCYMEQLINELEYDDRKLLRKSILFKMTNSNEAYLIYAKDTTDYTGKLSMLDNLTKSLLLEPFSDYYRNFIQKSNKLYALCTLDIDKFKYINIAFGYKIGDSILKKISSVIRDFIGVEENYCRMNEDKFSIFLTYENENHLKSKISELSKNFKLMRDTYFNESKITIIGGVTLIDKNLTLNTLLDQSTIARKSGKGSLENNFSFYNPIIDIKIKKDIQIEERVPYAIANNEFVPFLQPKFDLNTKKICGAEALVRWITSDGMIYPDEFIPLFEKNGFITTLDFIVYDGVMKYIRHCLDNNLPVYPISVNVSRSHINDDDFIGNFTALIKKYNVPTKYLELEVTESVFVEDKNQLIEFIDTIKKENLKISIDDFGTAYSSLQTLTDIDVDILKIDKGFLDNVDLHKTDEVSKDEILIKNIINLAKDLGFKVICEGVETDEQIELLKKIGCELGQGYVFAKPMAIKDYENKFLIN